MVLNVGGATVHWTISFVAQVVSSNKHDRDFDNILRLNGYPERTIHETKHLQNHQRDPQTQCESPTSPTL